VSCFPCVFTCDSFTHQFHAMRCQVRLFVAGQIITETMVCRDYDHAKQIAIARNPDTQIIDVTAIFPTVEVK